MQRPPLPVLDQGDGWLIIGKPPHLLTHKTAMSSDRIAALQWVRDQVGCRVHAIHRLDRPASGCLLFATDPALASELQAALGAPQTVKQYVALVRGCIEPLAHTVVDRPLDGKASCTELTVLASLAEPRCSLVQCRITTGRFHQVRRHLAGLGHPILGDSRHGDTRVNRWWREHHDLPRLMLHAHRLELDAPDRRAVARCPIWPDMAKIVRSLPLWDAACAADPSLAVDFDQAPPWAERARDAPTHRRSDGESESAGSLEEKDDPS